MELERVDELREANTIGIKECVKNKIITSKLPDHACRNVTLSGVVKGKLLTTQDDELSSYELFQTSFMRYHFNGNCGKFN